MKTSIDQRPRWNAMKRRCYNKKCSGYKYYGGRGIFIADEWLNFHNFNAWCLKTFEPGKSLDRVNNDGPYSPENCRWATKSEQMKNCRVTKKKASACAKNWTKAIKSMHKKYGDPKTRERKYCKKCNQIKSTTDFYFCKSHYDGYSGWCMVCSRKDKSIRRLKKNRTNRSGG